MIIPYLIQESSPGLWRVEWGEGFAVDVYLNGRLRAENVTTGFIGFPGEKPPPVEVVEHGERPQSAYAAPWIQVQWRGVAGAKFYRVQRKAGSGAWRTVAGMPEDGRGYYVWQSPSEQDGLELEYRVVVDAGGAGVVGAASSWRVIRHPDAPAVGIAVETDSNGDGYLVITEAAPTTEGGGL